MGKSSKDKRDAYYRLAKEQNWRARSAFKLIQIDEQFDLFEHENPEKVTRVVDLCAAPGSWSQVLSRVLIKGESFGRRAWVEKKRKEQAALAQLNAVGEAGKNNEDAEKKLEEDTDSSALKPRKNVKIVSIDLQPMAPLQAYDSTTSSSPHAVRQPHPVDLVISDGAPDVTGLHDLDIYIQSQLLYSALNLALGVLRPGGKFVAKIFRDRDVDLLYAQLRTVFERVSVAKPRSSRASSLEAFVVCEGFIPPAVHDGLLGMDSLKSPLFGGAAIPPQVSADGNVALEVPEEDYEVSTAVQPVTLTGSIKDNQTRQLHAESGNASTPEPLSNKPQKFAAENRWIPSFIACGDLSAWDSDASYSLPPDHVSLDPVQPPMAPPYRRALELRKEKGGAYGKTKMGTMGRA
ncbi:hypothetical protein AOCH_000530 [Aspergillus ochraceoroseus]|uniref:Putative tRNA (cytidine(32)/guanosine(34)-2'-O)-methyltransferase n=1 Tax=Aspergillus ochraceoroseus TaxID=138278 RepID=A0A0F8UTU7_9EURO|nr:hypothetical protein AOCH_000530 [Aspergillus ochraceoroseus]